MEKSIPLSDKILYQSKGGSTSLYISYLIDLVICTLFFVVLQTDDARLTLLLRFGRSGLTIPWLFLILDILLGCGIGFLYLSKLVIYDSRIEGTPFSIIRSTSITIARDQIVSVEMDKNKGFLIIHTATGKQKFPCKDVQTAYNILMQA